MGGADVNPYLVMAACLAGGLHGLEDKIDPPGAYTDDAYVDDGLVKLPGTLEAALDRMRSSDLAKRWFGESFVEHYLLMKQAEVNAFRGVVTDWERRHYVITA